jgi:hypothetical protein
MLTKRNDNSLHSEGRISDRQILATMNTRASVISARPDITAGLQERKLNRPYALQGRYSLSEEGAGPFGFVVDLATHLDVH